MEIFTYFVFFQTLSTYSIFRLANLAQHVMSEVLFYQLLVCALIIALSMVSLQSNNLFSYDTIVSLYIVVWVSFVAFIYCHLSDSTTSTLLEIGDFFYGCDWFMLPVKYQKWSRWPIQCSQRIFHFNGLGLLNCSLRTFFSVITLC